MNDSDDDIQSSRSSLTVAVLAGCGTLIGSWLLLAAIVWIFGWVDGSYLFTVLPLLAILVAVIRFCLITTVCHCERSEAILQMVWTGARLLPSTVAQDRRLLAMTELSCQTEPRHGRRHYSMRAFLLPSPTTLLSGSTFTSPLKNSTDFELARLCSH